MTKDALAKQGINIPDLSKFTGGGQRSNDQPDGNCVSTSSSSSGFFSGGHLPHFRSGEGSVKKWCGQDYKVLKRQCNDRGMLFEDPEFPASNHLLVDDNQQFVISYFGRTRFESNSIALFRCCFHFVFGFFCNAFGLFEILIVFAPL